MKRFEKYFELYNDPANRSQLISLQSEIQYRRIIIPVRKNDSDYIELSSKEQGMRVLFKCTDKRVCRSNHLQWIEFCVTKYKVLSLSLTLPFCESNQINIKKLLMKGGQKKFPSTMSKKRVKVRFINPNMSELAHEVLKILHSDVPPKTILSECKYFLGCDDFCTINAKLLLIGFIRIFEKKQINFVIPTDVQGIISRFCFVHPDMLKLNQKINRMSIRQAKEKENDHKINNATFSHNKNKINSGSSDGIKNHSNVFIVSLFLLTSLLLYRRQANKRNSKFVANLNSTSKRVSNPRFNC